MSDSSASTDSYSRWFRHLSNYNSDTVTRKHVSADDDGRDLWFSGFVEPSKKRNRHVERVLRRMGR